MRGKPDILVAASTLWLLSARLAIALDRAGCRVSAVCPAAHPLRHVRSVGRLAPQSRLRPRASLLAAIRAWVPDLVIPCDDRTTKQLHELHRLCPDLRPLIERSLGDPAGFPVTESRQALRTLAAAKGIDVPEGCEVGSAAEAAAAFGRFAPAAVVKLDGSYGGDGVQVVHSGAEAAKAFRRLRFRLGLGTALKRLVVNQETTALWAWSRRADSRVSMQAFVPGYMANIMVACWQGKVLATVSVEVVSSQGPMGAANVVRIVDRPQFVEAARVLAAELGISGFFGLDFIVEAVSGRAVLIEMNPRCTQLGHLQLPEQGDLAAILCGSLTGRSPVPPDHPIPGDTVAFFPQARYWSPDGRSPPDAFDDVPWEDEGLVEALQHEPWRDAGLIGAIYHRFRGQRTRACVVSAPAQEGLPSDAGGP